MFFLFQTADDVPLISGILQLFSIQLFSRVFLYTCFRFFHYFIFFDRLSRFVSLSFLVLSHLLSLSLLSLSLTLALLLCLCIFLSSPFSHAVSFSSSHSVLFFMSPFPSFSFYLSFVHFPTTHVHLTAINQNTRTGGAKRHTEGKRKSNTFSILFSFEKIMLARRLWNNPDRHRK